MLSFTTLPFLRTRNLYRSAAVCSLIGLAAAACSSEDSSTASGGGGAGGAGALGGFGAFAGAGASGGSGGAGATGGSAGSTGGSAGAGATGGSGGTAGSAGSGGAAGSGGFGGLPDGGVWPDCSQAPSGVATKTLPAIWADNPSTATAAWVPNVIVTAISGGGCKSLVDCQFFVQQQETYATLAAGAKQSLRVEVPSKWAGYFTQIKVGDRVDLYGWAWRHTANGHNELHFEVSETQQGCVKVVGTANPAPIPGVTLQDLTVVGYETTQGPMLVKIDLIRGTPGKPNETFGLWKAGDPFIDGGANLVVSMSPFFLPNYAFTGFQDGILTNFTYVTGVFGLFIPQGSTSKYKQLYIRSMADAPIGIP